MPKFGPRSQLERATLHPQLSDICDEAIKYVDLAKRVGIQNVSLKGRMTKHAQDMISMPGLLNYFSSENASKRLPEIFAILTYHNWIYINTH